MPPGDAGNPRRPPWQLLKELVQNVWDEAPEATICRVEIRPAGTGEDLLSIRVEDDGPGFADIADAWTLMKHTPRRENPSQRGRFNLGETDIRSRRSRDRNGGPHRPLPPDGRAHGNAQR